MGLSTVVDFTITANDRRRRCCSVAGLTNEGPSMNVTNLTIQGVVPSPSPVAGS